MDDPCMLICKAQCVTQRGGTSSRALFTVLPMLLTRIPSSTSNNPRGASGLTIISTGDGQARDSLWAEIHTIFANSETRPTISRLHDYA